MSDLIARLEQHAGTRPGAAAVRGVDAHGAVRELTWRELRSAVAATAAVVRESPAESVLVLQRATSLDLLVDLLGGLMARRAVLPLPATMPRAEVERLLARMRVPPEALLTDSVTRSVAAGRSGAADSRANLGTSHSWRPASTHSWSHSGVRDDHSRCADRVDTGSVLLCSSGTTGAPKIVRRPQRALDALARGCVASLGIDAGDTMLLPIPLHHSYGIDMGMLTAIYAGCCLEIHERFQGALVLDALERRAITLLPAVPMIFDGLARLGRRGKVAHVLRRAISAGSPLPVRIYERVEDALGVRLAQIYGATEFGSLTFNDPELPGFDPSSAGRPIGDAEIRIVDAEEPKLEQPFAPEETGQLAVRTSTLLSEYVEDTTPATRDGFFFPGDLGRLSRDGVLTLTGRLKLLIEMGSVKVNPFEIETVLAQHPGVRDVVVLGVQASETVSRLKAIVIPEVDRAPSIAELRAFARERLIHYKVPRSFEVRSEVPRSPTGKILRGELQAQLNRDREGPDRERERLDRNRE